jgi:hypothetical protein
VVIKPALFLIERLHFIFPQGGNAKNLLPLWGKVGKGEKIKFLLIPG